jgi:hypothetical protein
MSVTHDLRPHRRMVPSTHEDPKGRRSQKLHRERRRVSPQSVRWEQETVARQAPAVPVWVDNIRSAYSAILSLATGVFHLRAAERQEDHDDHCAREPLSWIVRRLNRPPDPEAFSAGQSHRIDDARTLRRVARVRRKRFRPRRRAVALRRRSCGLLLSGLRVVDEIGCNRQKSAAMRDGRVTGSQRRTTSNVPGKPEVIAARARPRLVFQR